MLISRHLLPFNQSAIPESFLRLILVASDPRSSFFDFVPLQLLHPCRYLPGAFLKSSIRNIFVVVFFTCFTFGLRLHRNIPKTAQGTARKVKKSTALQPRSIVDELIGWWMGGNNSNFEFWGRRGVRVSHSSLAEE